MSYCVGGASPSALTLYPRPSPSNVNPIPPYPSVAIAPALAKLVGHKNRDVQMNSMLYTCKCVQSMNQEQITEKLGKCGSWSL